MKYCVKNKTGKYCNTGTLRTVTIRRINYFFKFKYHLVSHKQQIVILEEYLEMQHSSNCYRHFLLPFTQKFFPKLSLNCRSVFFPNSHSIDSFQEWKRKYNWYTVRASVPIKHELNPLVCDFFSVTLISMEHLSIMLQNKIYITEESEKTEINKETKSFIKRILITLLITLLFLKHTKLLSGNTPDNALSLTFLVTKTTCGSRHTDRCKNKWTLALQSTNKFWAEWNKNGVK